MPALGLALGLPYGRKAAAGFTGALDAYTTNLTLAISSARRLLTSYTGNIIKVRRSGDNAESDIAALASGSLDSSTMAAFCVAGGGTQDGLLTTAYNQVGSINFAQSTASRQPLIVASGATYAGINSRPTMKFDGADDCLPSATNALTVRTLYIVAQLRSSPSGSKVLWDFGGSNACATFVNNTTEFRYFATSAGGVSIVSASPLNKQIFAINIASTSSAFIRANGVSGATFDPNDDYTLSAVRNIGSYLSGSLFGDWDVTEVLGYSTSHNEATMDAIEAILASYYGITL